MAGPVKSYGASNFLFALEGEAPSVVKTVSGGGMTADVVEIPKGDARMSSKTLGPLKCNPTKMELGIVMGGEMLEWVNAFLNNSHIYKQGSITYGDFDKKARSYLDLKDILLTSFGIPACDAASKDDARLSIEMRATESFVRDGDAADLKGVLNVKQKAYMCHNFKVTVGDLPCANVNKVDAITITCAVQQNDVGERRVSELVPTVTKCGNLVLTISSADEKAWQQWHKDFCHDGNNGQDKELQGSIEWLDPATKKTVASLEMKQIGIFDLASDAATGGGDSVRRFKASMYVEEFQFKITPP